MLIEKDIKEIRQVDNLEEANSMIKLGWVLLETGSKIENDLTSFFFLLGKTGKLDFAERVAKFKEEEAKKVVTIKSES